ncbi:nuatigenin 3-beta-glucosyltransferase-like [Lycium ferocissimum]|uniref:nuatigenin 3-beta-glucosyltransferase-like n=1 Tax=Lycium ferocissimum TaxID=112874 RepID=UPI002814F836|nr:nuatigenin 3-beta-glucosyltransferase-like [Lycium ferocissimum]
MAAIDNGKRLHVLFLPYFATGHIIPLVNAARLFAYRGVNVTILTTHHNASLFRSSIDNDDNHSIIFIDTLRFPSTQVGLPEGIENFSIAPSSEMSGKIFHAIYLLQKPMEDKIREIRPDCIFSDMYFPWTVDIAKELNIPRLLFNQSSYMYHSILHNLKLYKPHKQISTSSSSTNFLVPGLPDKIKFKLSQLTEDLVKPEDERSPYDELLDQIQDVEDQSYGIVHDTFYELEPAYADYYQKIKKIKCWHIGPISHFSSKLIPKKEVTNAAADKNSCAIVEWLNEQKPKSVLYVSFGSIVILPEGQLTEIAKALAASTLPFIWVVRKDQSEQVMWLPDGFEERKNGLIIKGWAPQLTILDHSALGGFMTHCGWNSVLEAIVAGVPMLTWPLSAEQFYNEKLVEVVGLGVKVGSEICNLQGGEILSPIIGSKKIKEAIERLMSDGSKESQEIREKAIAVSEMAKNAIGEGGSSWNSLTALIDDIKNFTSSS